MTYQDFSQQKKNLGLRVPDKVILWAINRLLSVRSKGVIDIVTAQQNPLERSRG